LAKSIGAQPVPHLNIEDFISKNAFSQLSWGHHILLIQKIKDIPTRMWYARQTIEQGWSRDVLTAQIKSEADQRQGAAITNFGDDKVAGIFQMPSAESLATSEVTEGSGYGTWNVPATLGSNQ
jgi:DUF1016 N-terminal domain